jgi:hypothetical protein
MSRLAYVKEKNRLVEYLKRASFALVDAVNYNLQVSPMQFFIAEKSSGTGQPIVVVAFRGSEIEDYKDVTTDIGIVQDAWVGKGKVHTGFSKALPEAEIEKLHDKLASLKSTDPCPRLLITGHSLGAALAVLASAVHHPDYLYTFGCPRVGNQEFAESVHHVDHARYVNCLDVVTTVPAAPWWWHVGQFRYIDRNGKVIEPYPATELEEAVLLDRGLAELAYQSFVFKYNMRNPLHPLLVPFRSVADHGQINYLSGVLGLRA